MPLMSMTGYGRSQIVTERRWSVEFRSVNHRYLDLRFRLPRSLTFVEGRIRALLREHLLRGHVDITIHQLGGESEGKVFCVDTRLAATYHNALTTLALELNLPGNVTLDQVASLPEVFYWREQPTDADEVWEGLHPSLNEALEQLLTARRFEGQRLEADFRERLQRLHLLWSDIRERAPAVVKSYRESLMQRLESLMPEKVPLDQARISEELLLFAERSDVHEELIRIQSHLDHALLSLDQQGSGRRLEFLLQELLREFNTLGAKANDAAIARHVIEAKLELEKCREQVQNVE